jgi:hypothetical protein
MLSNTQAHTRTVIYTNKPMHPSRQTQIQPHSSQIQQTTDSYNKHTQPTVLLLTVDYNSPGNDGLIDPHTHRTRSNVLLW